ncbi:MAG TPA: alpha-2-macroglobulin [Spirochaetaceae bacterium]|nr:alpha-2-macroglobulin [Spirochaetaceae bacterium]
MKFTQRVFMFIAAAALVAAFSCAKAPQSAAPDPTVVVAHSAGIVSRGAEISVVLANGRDTSGFADAQPFTFTPAVKGRISWSDDGSRASFKPEGPLKAGQSYRVRFDFAAIGEESNGWFSFDIMAAQPSISVLPGGVYAAWNGSLALDGLVRAEDIAAAADVERLVSASIQGKALPLSWSHEGQGIHRFTVKDIPRGQDAAELLLSWNAASAGALGKGSERFRIPAEGSFELLSVRGPAPGEPSCLTVSFSQALDRSQDIRGLIRADGAGELRYETEGGVVRLYSSLRWPDEVGVQVEKGLRSELHGALAIPAQARVSLNWEKPEVRFPAGGVIVPSTQGTKVILETKNLGKVYVEALRVYGDNMLQFLQVNELGGTSELKRVGEVVWSAELDLSWTEDKKNQWTPYALDLSPLLAKHSDGLFQLRVAFSREHIRYVCANNHSDTSNWVFPPATVVDRDSGDDSYWDYYDEYFDWNEYYRYREDPCHPAFYALRYGRDRTARRNVLVSDVGIMAKQDSDGAWRVAATDLKSARPLPGASVKIYNYALRELAGATADKDGLATLKPIAGQGSGPTFMVVEAAKASSGRERGYLKLLPSQQLAVSHFDIGGEKADTGVKGFIYGERGVWRPGDDMHLVFVLYDRLKTLPADHPVSFELLNPLGQVVRQSSYTKSIGGFYYIKTGTDASAPTGNWSARVRVGGKTFTKTIKVEMVMPNRLKLSLDYGAKPYLSSSLDAMGISAAWLHGAPAPNLKADVSMVLSASAKAPGNYPGYIFLDPMRSVQSERSVLFDGYLDGQGKARFPVYLSPEYDAPGPLSASFLSRAFESSGLFSSEQFTVDFHPYERYVGMKLPAGDASRGMLLTDTNHPVEIIVVDQDGKVAGNAQVEVSLYKLQWRWWWEKGEESLAEHASDVYNKLLKKETVSIKNGRGTYSLRLNYPEWGRYLLRVSDVSGGHATGSVFYMDWPGWAGRGRAEGGGSAFMLSLSAEKERYEVGENVRVSFPSNKEGRAFVTVERSGRVLEQRWVDARDGTTSYEFRATADMAPNVYVHVSFVQPHLQTANDLPIRLYGVVPVMVENAATRLEPVIKAPAALEPNAKASFSVSEKTGKAMSYTVAVVDEGLLGITRYAAPNPWNEFYKKEASMLASFDMYKDVAGAFSGQLQTLLSIGGSEFGDGGGNRKVNRFPPVVRFFGPFQLSRGQTQSHELELGPYVGAVRFMVVAGTPDGAYGKAELETPVRSELMAFITAPRVLGPGEKATIPVAAFGFLGANARGRLTLTVEGQASIVGPSAKDLFWPTEGEQLVDFELEVKPETGAVRIRAELSSPGKKSSIQTIDIPVRSAAVPVTNVESVLVEGKKNASLQLALPGIAGSNEAWLELSLLPPIDLSSGLSWLLGYPHGCGEQTTSKAFPQLFLADAMALTPEQAEAARANVAAAITKLAEFQTARGGFVFWPGGYEESAWLSVYISHFLVMAEKQGYTVPATLKNPALDFLRGQAMAYSGREDYAKAEQAYRLYVLALAGKPDMASMNRFVEYGPHRSAALFQLAAAYALAGQKARAAELIRGEAIDLRPYAGIERVYGSELRDKAIVLDALNQLGDSARALPLFKSIAEELSNKRGYYSTQSLSYALLASLPYMKATSSGSANVRYSYAGGQGSVTISKAIARVPLSARDGTMSLRLDNDSSAAVYARIVATGTPLPGNEQSFARGLSLVARYLGTDETVVDPGSAELGQDLIVELEVANRYGENLSDIALSFRSPSGWEISNLRVGRTGDQDEDGLSSAYDYQDVRDDRVLTYFGLKRGETKTFRIFVNKSYAGEYFLPAISAEVMYKPELYAVIPGRPLRKLSLPPTTAPRGGSAPRL